MALPASPDEILEVLFEKRREFTAKLQAAEARGDSKTTRALQIELQAVVSLIRQNGGDVH
jgi:hypothetical protein